MNQFRANLQQESSQSNLPTGVPTQSKRKMGIRLDLETLNPTETANLPLANMSQQPRCSSDFS